MSSRIENVIRAAIHTFSRKHNGSFADAGVMENIERLRQLVSDITADDLGGIQLSEANCKNAPVSYMEIFENHCVSVGVFVLKEGACIPLHDHPGMYGVLKVLQGNLHIQNFTPDTDIRRLQSASSPGNLQVISALKYPAMELTKEVAVLLPTERNIHQLWTVDSPASFLDILSPPYCVHGNDPSQNRDCTYFKELPHPEGNMYNLSSLMRISCPSTFWCDLLPYTGPYIEHLKEEFQ